jgi:4-hydroxy-3-methylbut-2-enyl diphosphate reductase
VIRADVLGYCFGVRRAVEKARSVRREFPGAEVLTYGPLIHNPAALETLGREGIRALDDGVPAEEIPPDAAVVIRAHGVPPAVRAALKKRAALLVDASCPRVLANQKKAAELARRGCTVAVAGDRKHAETLAIAGSAGGCGIIEDRAGAEAFAAALLARGRPRKVALLAQTTIGQGEYDAIAGALRAAFPDLTEWGEICPATVERQGALEKLCREADGVLVVGGRASANTRRLFASAQGYARNPAYRARLAALIESAGEIPGEFFSLPVAGITAGASTPDETIQAVEEALGTR